MDVPKRKNDLQILGYQTWKTTNPKIPKFLSLHVFARLYDIFFALSIIVYLIQLKLFIHILGSQNSTSTFIELYSTLIF